MIEKRRLLVIVGESMFRKVAPCTMLSTTHLLCPFLLAGLPPSSLVWRGVASIRGPGYPSTCITPQHTLFVRILSVDCVFKAVLTKLKVQNLMHDIL